MPSRLWSILIVGVWLSVAGWFFTREILPQLGPDLPPPFTIDLADEVSTSIAPTMWIMQRAGKTIGTARTWTEYHSADDSFELAGELKDLRILDLAQLPFFALGDVNVKIPLLSNSIRVNREGRLLAIQSRGKLSVPNFELTAEFTGRVENGQLVRSCRVQGPGINLSPELEPGQPPKTNFLTPLLPVSKIRGLRSGQSWTQPLIDPAGDTVQVAMRPILEHFLAQLRPAERESIWKLIPTNRGPASLKAQVSGPTELEWQTRPHSCWLIEYLAGDEVKARTWVRVNDAIILRQEVVEPGGQVIVLLRI